MNSFEEFLSNNFDKKWDWINLSRNPQITTQFVDAYPDKPWFYGATGLSSNPNVTPAYVKLYNYKNWNYGKDGLSSNPSMTIEFIQETITQRWDFKSLSSLVFNNEKEVLNISLIKNIDPSTDYQQILSLKYHTSQYNPIYKIYFKIWVDDHDFNIRLYNICDNIILNEITSSNTDPFAIVSSDIIEQFPIKNFVLSIDIKNNSQNTLTLNNISITSFIR
jgi:hypothetical protein